jgi:hypothetical protein
MPTEVFYPTAGSQPVAGEGSLIEGAGATNWTNITTKYNKDSDSLTNAGSLTQGAALPYAGSVNEFAYTDTTSIGAGGFSKMFRLGTWLRITDNADVATVLSASATITAIAFDFRVNDADLGISGTGGPGVNSYQFQAQQRTSGGAFGSVVTSTSFFDFGALAPPNDFYFYRPSPNFINLAATLPTTTQLRDSTYALNARLGFTGDVFDNSPAMGFNGVRMSVTFTEPSTASARIRPSRARSRVIW